MVTAEFADDIAETTTPAAAVHRADRAGGLSLLRRPTAPGEGRTVCTGGGIIARPTVKDW